MTVIVVVGVDGVLAVVVVVVVVGVVVVVQEIRNMDVLERDERPGHAQLGRAEGPEFGAGYAEAAGCGGGDVDVDVYWVRWCWCRWWCPLCMDTDAGEVRAGCVCRAAEPRQGRCITARRVG